MPRDLAVGAYGLDVKNLQMILNLNRDPHQARLIEDGAFGPQTLARVKEFQAYCGLTADGIVGPLTRMMLLPERTYSLQAALAPTPGGGYSVGSPALRFGLAGAGPAAPVSDPTPPTPAPPYQTFQQFQILAGGQQAFFPSVTSPLVLTAQFNQIIRNPGKPDFVLTLGGQFALNSSGPAGDWTGQGFAQMGLALNTKLAGFDLLNPFVVTMLQRNQGQPFTWGVGIGDQVNYALDKSGRLALFLNGQVVVNTDLSTGLASAPGLQILGGVSFTFGQMPPDP